MSLLFSQFKNVWRAFVSWLSVPDREILRAGRFLEADADETIRRLIDRIPFALKLLEIPMAVIDDVTAAFAAYDSKIAAAEAAIAPLQAHVADLTAQLAAIDAAAVAKVGELTPAPVAAEPVQAAD